MHGVSSEVLIHSILVSQDDGGFNHHNNGEVGPWSWANGCVLFYRCAYSSAVNRTAQQTERLGYAALWYPEVLSYESFALGSFLLQQSETLIIASGIANIYARDATAAKQGQHTLATLSGGRFLLGLGVSHVPLVEDTRGHHYRQPVETMRAYLDADTRQRHRATAGGTASDRAGRLRATDDGPGRRAHGRSLALQCHP